MWKSSDGGENWAPLTDSQGSLSIGAIAISADGKTVYAGTGSPDQAYDSYPGAGILKSTDGGKTWVNLGASVFANDSTSAVLLFSSQPGRILVSTTESNCCRLKFQPTVSRLGTGIFLSMDGGASWTKVYSSKASAPGSYTYPGVSSMIQDPTNQSVIYAGDYAGNVLVSTDGGATFAPLLSQNSNLNPGGRVALAMSPAAPSELFLAVSTNNGSDIGLFRYDTSSHAEDSLGYVLSPACGNGCNFHLALAVNPADATKLYFGAVTWLQSFDGGSTWEDLGWNAVSCIYQNYTSCDYPNTYVDQHSLVFQPGDPSTFYVADDGGLYKFENGGSTMLPLNDNLGTALTLSLAGKPGGPIYAGLQDLGCYGYQGAQTKTWKMMSPYTGGDGTWVGYESTNPSIIYCMSPFIFQKSTDGGTTWNEADTGLKLNALVFGPPVVQDPQHPGTIYIGGSHVYKTTNYAQNWTDIGPICQNRCVEVASMVVAPSNGNIIYAGDALGNLEVSMDAGHSWQQVARLSGAPTGLSVDPNDPLRVYASVQGNLAPMAFTLSCGVWKQTSLSPLPSLPYEIESSPTQSAYLFAGTHSGAYYSSDGGTTWAPIGAGLPNAPVFSLLVSQEGILVGTHGRGVWQVAFQTPASGTQTNTVTTTCPSSTSASSSTASSSTTGHSTSSSSTSPSTSTTESSSSTAQASSSANQSNGIPEFSPDLFLSAVVVVLVGAAYWATRVRPGIRR